MTIDKAEGNPNHDDKGKFSSGGGGGGGSHEVDASRPGAIKDLKAGQQVSFSYKETKNGPVKTGKGKIEEVHESSTKNGAKMGGGFVEITSSDGGTHYVGANNVHTK